MTAPETSEYPGLEAIVHRAFDRAREGLPPDVGIGVMFAFHFGEGGGMAWVAGTARLDAINMITEWLANQVRQGHGEAVRSAMEKWFTRGEMP